MGTASFPEVTYRTTGGLLELVQSDVSRHGEITQPCGFPAGWRKPLAVMNRPPSATAGSGPWPGTTKRLQGNDHDRCGRKTFPFTTCFDDLDALRVWAKGLAEGGRKACCRDMSACYMPRMTAIVGVHGIAQQFRGGYQLGAKWYNALRDGLANAGYRSVADALAPADVRVAFFGNLFRPPGTMAAWEPPYSPDDVEPGPERDLLAEFYRAAVEQEPSLGAPEGTMGLGKASVPVMLDRLLRSRTFARVAERALIGNLKQVTRFLKDATVKDLVLGRVDEDVDDSTRVMIGHSLGSVVAYEYLCRCRPSSVELLVTLGSPLGIPNLIFDRLTPAPANGAGAWPGTVADWVNVADRDDIVALRKQLAGLFPGPGGVTEVDDRLVDNGNQPHAIDRYLSARETGGALGDVLS